MNRRRLAQDAGRFYKTGLFFLGEFEPPEACPRRWQVGINLPGNPITCLNFGLGWNKNPIRALNYLLGWRLEIRWFQPNNERHENIIVKSDSGP